MNILLVSWYFPPANEIGAIRVGKMAEDMLRRGHDVRVLTAGQTTSDNSLASTFPEDRIVRTSWIDVDTISSPWRLMSTVKQRVGNTNTSPYTGSTGSWRSRIRESYAALVRMPDRQIGWLPALLRAGRKMLNAEKADIIVASGPPFTTFLGAASLAKRFRIPWIAEYRDGWSEYLYSPKPKWRDPIDVRMENRTLASAAGIVALTEPWRDYYAARFQKPTIAAYNGYDEDILAPDGSREAASSEPVSIAYLGALYQGLRDPHVLYEALAISGLTPRDVEVRYYGPTIAEVLSQAKLFGVEQFVHVFDRVPHEESLQIERKSDVLLLLQSPSDPNNVPAKTFEYLAARRPILGLGLDEGIPAQLVNDRKAGLYKSDVPAVARQLQAWVVEKRQQGFIADLPKETYAGLSRQKQFDQVDALLKKVGDSTLPQQHLKKQKVRSSMRPAHKSDIVAFPTSARPRLIVIVDAEEEFDWSRPFSQKETNVSTMRHQHLAQRVFERYGVIPTYAVDYPVANQADGYLPLREILQSGGCEIGAQLHAWVTPPHEEDIGEQNSYPGNLPAHLELSKLEHLTRVIEDNFGVRPRLYRAGRYGTGANSAGMLEALGYQIDCSVLPESLPSSIHATDYTGIPNRPFWFGKSQQLLEIPVTTSAVGTLPRLSPAFADALSPSATRRLGITPLLARSRMLDRIRLSPEGNTLAEVKRLTRAMCDSGHRVFAISYHSPSLGVGNTPYVRSQMDLDRFIAWLDDYMTFFFGEIDGVPSTPRQVFEWASTLNATQAAPSPPA